MLTTYNWFLHRHLDENWAWANIFTKEECEQIIEIGKSLDIVQGGAAGDVDGTIRKSTISWIPSSSEEYAWVFSKCAGMIIDTNNKFFNFDLTYIENLQFSIYDESDQGRYGRHVDFEYMTSGQRKLSFSILLEDPELYTGGDLVLHYKPQPYTVKREQGVATVFPSTMLHEVTPVTKGTRYSLVGWVVGPRLK
jgi:PKHD-type hydroxylase